MWTQNKRAHTPHSQVRNTEPGNLSNEGRRWFSSTGNEFICAVRKTLLYRSRKRVMDPHWGGALSGTSEVTVPSLYNHLQLLPPDRSDLFITVWVSLYHSRSSLLHSLGPGRGGFQPQYHATLALPKSSTPWCCRGYLCAPGTVPGVRETMVNTIDGSWPRGVYAGRGVRGMNSKHNVTE